MNIPNKTRKSPIVLGLLGMVIGFIIVALPDSDERLFSLSEDHGPSLLDAIGLVVLITSYLLLVREAWKNREKVRPFSRSTPFYVGLFLGGLGLGLIIASVGNDYEGWWIWGIVLLNMVQLPLFYVAFK